MKNKIRKAGNSEGCAIIFYLVLFICWVINIIGFFSCDFEAPVKREVIKGVGVVLPIFSPITMWFPAD